ncbi:MAG: EamA/RhaT family transporter [Alphaproteobacteria bacterium]|nr:MAG: EamA/RhaT family transporter [Alphaproteobacteria bacterium]
MSPKHLLLILTIALIWGTNFVVAKIGMAEFPPYLFTMLRFAFLAVVLAPFLKWHPGRMDTIVKIGILAGGFHFAFFFGGLAVSTASVAAIVVQLNAPFATLMSVIFLKEQVGWRRWSGIGLAVGGVMVISFDPEVFGYLGGMALMALSALMYGIASVYMRRLQGVGVFELQSWTAVLSLPILLAMSLIFEHDQLAAMADASWAGWSTIVYTAIFASLVGHGGMYYLYQRYEVSTVAPMMLLSPLIGIASGVLFLSEALTVRILIGGASVLFGVGIIAFRQRAQKPLEAINEQS